MDQLGYCQTEGRLAGKLAFPFGSSDVGILSYDYGREGDVYLSGDELSIHPGIQGIFWKCVL